MIINAHNDNMDNKLYCLMLIIIFFSIAEIKMQLEINEANVDLHYRQV